MADVKISQLPAATTPLAGTELVPIVQGGVTKQVIVSAIGNGIGNNLANYADDTAAAAGGVAIGGMYRTGSLVKVRVS